MVSHRWQVIRAVLTREVIEDSKHIEELKNEKRAARKHASMDNLRLAAPSSTEFLVQAGDRGHNLGRIARDLKSSYIYLAQKT